MENKVLNFVENKLSGICSAHDMAHIKRVCKLAKIIWEDEKNGDFEVIEAGALLHEMFDEKFFSEKQMIQTKKEILETLKNSGFSDEKIEKVFFIIENIGYGKSIGRTEKIEMIEFQIVEDADRLEAIGAIAIARTFAYGGRKHREIYNPEIPFVEYKSKNDYHTRENTTSINHFYEKLLKLKNLLNTKKAKKLAEDRHKFMEDFLKQFFKEWNLEE